MPSNLYLKDNRLEDVLVLIQYLGLGSRYSLLEGNSPHGSEPRSADAWLTVASQHPEFFRVTPANSIVLSMRYYQRGANGTRPPLNAELVQQLVQNALALQEKQSSRAEI